MFRIVEDSTSPYLSPSYVPVSPKYTATQPREEFVLDSLDVSEPAEEEEPTPAATLPAPHSEELQALLRL